MSHLQEKEDHLSSQTANMVRQKNIVIFHRSFFEISETFIYEQVKTLAKNHRISLLAYNYLNEQKFPLAENKYALKPVTNKLDILLSKLFERFLSGNSQMSIFNKAFAKSLLKRLNADMIHAHFGINAVGILPVAKALQIPMVVSFHGIDASPELLKYERYSRHLKELFDYADKIVIVSPHMIETLGLHSYASKVHLIPYGVDFNVFNRNGVRTSSQDGIVRILHSGRLVDKKGVPDLVKVFSKLCEKYDNIHLTIIGDGPEADTCRQLIAAAQCEEKVSMLGAQPNSSVLEHMNSSDIFILNCRTGKAGDMEGMPVSILEAMSMELPVLTTYHAGIPQAITSEENGILVAEEANIQLSDALERLISSEELRIKLGKNARQTIIDRFSLNLNRQRISQIFD